MTARCTPQSVAMLVRGLLLLVCAGLFGGTALAQDSAESQITIARGEAVQITNIDDWLIGVNTADAVNWEQLSRFAVPVLHWRR